MKRILDYLDNPAELFDAYVFLIAPIVTRFLVGAGHTFIAFLQGIIWVGYMYKLHYDSQEERDTARTLREYQDKLDRSESRLSEAEKRLDVAYSLLTDEQLKEFYKSL